MPGLSGGLRIVRQEGVSKQISEKLCIVEASGEDITEGKGVGTGIVTGEPVIAIEATTPKIEIK